MANGRSSTTITRRSTTSGTRSRPRRTTTRPRTRTFSSTKEQRDAMRGGGDGAGKYLVPLAGLGLAAALIFWGPKLWAGQSPTPTPRPGTDPNVVPIPPRPPGPSPWPATARLARIAVSTGESGMNLRGGPAPTGAIMGTVRNGALVEVLMDDVAETGRADTPGRYRWAQIRTAPGGGTFWMRSVGPSGERNIQPASAAEAAAPIQIGGAPGPEGGFQGSNVGQLLPPSYVPYGAGGGCGPGTGCLAHELGLLPPQAPVAPATGAGYVRQNPLLYNPFAVAPGAPVSPFNPFMPGLRIVRGGIR